MHTVVIGAGWAGLAAAVELCQSKDHQVTLLEAARQAGGRARSVAFGDIQVDNGQHLLIGAYHQTLQLLKAIGIDEATAFERHPLELTMRNATLIDSDLKDVRMRAAALPAPLHMLVALTMARGLTLAERWQALRLCAALPGLKLDSQGDISVSELLRRYRQSRRLIDQLWQPLCLAIMNTPADVASAAIFVRVLNDAFLHRRHDSDFLIPRRDLGALLPQPAIATIRKQGGEVRLACKVKALALDTNRVDQHIKAVILNDGTAITADQFIIATPPQACQRLLEGHDLFQPTVQQLSRLESAPIVTVYLHYPDHVTTDNPMTGLTGTTGQWLFDRRLCGQPGLMAVVISGHGPHETLDNDTLTEHISAELAGLFPHWPKPGRSLVIREKRATFTCHHQVHDHRPGHRTAARNGWLAGDYTDTGLPATLEGAVRSGVDCAQRVIATAHH